jgi:hypothetical protein
MSINCKEKGRLWKRKSTKEERRLRSRDSPQNSLLSNKEKSTRKKLRM